MEFMEGFYRITAEKDNKSLIKMKPAIKYKRTLTKQETH